MSQDPRYSYKKEWADKNKESIAKKKHEFYLANKDAIIEQKRVYNNLKRSTDPIFKLKSNLRSRLCMAVKKGFKGGSSIKDLGCSVEFFKSYLESKFESGMDWNNYGRGKGKWNIDHIKPLSLFDLSNREHIALVCHYTNLQPLWFEQNLLKSNKVA